MFLFLILTTNTAFAHYSCEHGHGEMLVVGIVASEADAAGFLGDAWVLHVSCVLEDNIALI